MKRNVLLSYSTRLLDGVTFDDSELTPPGNYKTPEAIQKWKDAKKDEFLASAATQPYTATLTEVRIALPVAGKIHKFVESSDPGKQSAAEKAAAVLEAEMTAGEGIMIYGFNVRDFLKIMGTECSLPGRTPAYPDLWIANGDHRDIAELVKPKEYSLSWPMVLKARNLDGKFGDWTRPHVNADQDLVLITELAVQLGLIGKPKR